MSETISTQRATAFSFVEQGAHAAIVHAGREILRFETNYLQWGTGNWVVLDQCMMPGEGPEVAALPIFSFLGGGADPIADVTYDVHADADSLTVTITPVRRLSGKAAVEKVRERCLFTVRLVEGRYVWEQRLECALLDDLDLAALDNGQTRYRVYRFPHQDGQPGFFMQFADPAPVGGSGPSVPMTRDWQFQPEPYNGPDSFRQSWTRRYVDIIFQNPDGSFSWSELNKTKWLNLTLDNRRARPCHPQGLLYLIREDGGALEYRCDAPSHYHHVCEWGMDYHFWGDLAPFMRGTVIPRGTTISAATTVRLVDTEIVQSVLAQARKIELTPREFAIANKPAYEEPENTFTVSALDRLSGMPWTPTSEGCRWETRGGYREGTGCLIIHNDYACEGSWEQRMLGPQNWANPFLAGKRYRLSAWVKVEIGEFDASELYGPQVGVEFTQSNGPGPTSVRQQIDAGWSAPLINVNTAIPTAIEWTYIELLTPPCPSYVFWTKLKLRFSGRGTATFSNVRWEMVDEE